MEDRTEFDGVRRALFARHDERVFAILEDASIENLMSTHTSLNQESTRLFR
ncbi:MAG: hypothetical protein ACR2RL_11695 [Gammaproteobacteria bacterium]